MPKETAPLYAPPNWMPEAERAAYAPWWARGRRDQPAERVASTTVMEEIATERRRQIEVEGWTPEHDDGYRHGELPRAAASYCVAPMARDRPWFWPWAPDWWKPKDRRRDLIRAAALIVAEIERLDRRASRRAENGCGNG